MAWNLHGKRVEIPAYTDEWMKGDRFGEVVATRGTRVNGEPVSARVLLDKSGKLIWFDAADVKGVDALPDLGAEARRLIVSSE